MDKILLEGFARAAGLDTVWREFREDLEAAAAQIEDQRRTLAAAPQPDAEPWPPMSVPTTDG